MRVILNVILISGFFFLGNSSIAQTFGVRAGYNVAKMNRINLLSSESDNSEYKSIPGFHVGMTVDYPIMDFMSVNSAILLTTRGYQKSESGDYNDATFFKYYEGSLSFDYIEKARIYYLDIPLCVNAFFEVSKETYVFGSFGAYFDLALFGTFYSKKEYDDSGTGIIDQLNLEQTEIIETIFTWKDGENNTEYKRFDTGLTFGAGIQIKSIELGLFYDYGLINIAAKDGNSSKNRVFRISLGFVFGK